MTRSIEDASIIFDALTNQKQHYFDSVRDPGFFSNGKQVRVGVLLKLPDVDLDSRIENVMKEAIVNLRSTLPAQFEFVEWTIWVFGMIFRLLLATSKINQWKTGKVMRVAARKYELMLSMV